MALYTKPPKELLLDLIKEANPTLPLPLNAANLSFGTPKAIALIPGSVANTEIVLSARNGSGYVKKVTVKYRRLSLETLFRGLNAEVYKYTAAGPSSYPFDLYGLLKEINLRFGLLLTEDDVTNTWFPWQNDKYYPDRRSSQAVMKAKPSSLVWVGETTLRWVSDKQSIADLVTKLEVTGRQFPDGSKVLTAQSKVVLNCDAFAYDFGQLCPDINSALLLNPLGINNGTIGPMHQQILNALIAYTGNPYSFNALPEPFALGGITPKRYTLPHADLPDANSVEYNRAIVIEYPESQSWGTGKLILHYNV